MFIAAMSVATALAASPCDTVPGPRLLVREISDAIHCLLITDGWQTTPEAPVVVDRASFAQLALLVPSVDSERWSAARFADSEEDPIETRGRDEVVRGNGIYLRLLDFVEIDADHIRLRVRSLVTQPNRRRPKVPCPMELFVDLTRTGDNWRVEHVQPWLVC